VASGNRSNRVNYRQQRKPKSESNAEISDFSSCQHCAADSSEYEHKCADKFGRIFLHFILPRFQSAGCCRNSIGAILPQKGTGV
jgi:hypothetical protein